MLLAEVTILFALTVPHPAIQGRYALAVIENVSVATQRERTKADEEIMKLLRELPAPRRPGVTGEERRRIDLLAARLRALGQDGVVLLSDALTSSEVGIRRNVLIELNNLGYGRGSSGRVAKIDIRAAQRALVRSLNDSDAYVRGWSLDALGAAGLPAEILPQVIEMLGDVEAGVRLSACAAVATYGGRAAGSRSSLERLLADSDADVRTCAKSAIEKIGGNVRAN